ncbi:MAG: diaminopimelate epimerase [Firmicutes bacterium]|nr:diaminopimelate epimerase [Bacillota bacterium]
MKFWKMNGTGNDFIIINNLEEKLPPEVFPKLARTLCERHLSIGADGLMVVEASKTADFKMLFYNSDGSLGEMCGNGARCICRYGYETGLAGEVQHVETTAGLVTGWRMDQRNYRVRLNDPSVIDLDRPVEVDGTTYLCSYVELGDPGIPHGVVEIPQLNEYPQRKLFDLGRALRNHETFYKGINVNFYEIIGPDHILERTYERGVEDFTYACGTGTGSLVSVLTLKGQVSGTNVRVDVPGGQLRIDVEVEGAEPEGGAIAAGKEKRVKNLYLTGPTNIVAKGEVTDEEVRL